MTIQELELGPQRISEMMLCQCTIRVAGAYMLEIQSCSTVLGMWTNGPYPCESCAFAFTAGAGMFELIKVSSDHFNWLFYTAQVFYWYDNGTHIYM